MIYNKNQSKLLGIIRELYCLYAELPTGSSLGPAVLDAANELKGILAVTMAKRLIEEDLK